MLSSQLDEGSVFALTLRPCNSGSVKRFRQLSIRVGRPLEQSAEHHGGAADRSASGDSGGIRARADGGGGPAGFVARPLASSISASSNGFGNRALFLNMRPHPSLAISLRFSSCRASRSASTSAARSHYPAAHPHSCCVGAFDRAAVLVGQPVQPDHHRQRSTRAPYPFTTASASPGCTAPVARRHPAVPVESIARAASRKDILRKNSSPLQNGTLAVYDSAPRALAGYMEFYE